MLAKIDLRRCLDTCGQVAVKVGVEIPLQYLILFKAAGDFDGVRIFNFMY